MYDHLHLKVYVSARTNGIPDILTFYYRLGIQLSEATLSIVLCVGCDLEGKWHHLQGMYMTR